MYKIAVPTTSDQMVDNHFGHCSQYTIFTIDNKSIVSRATMPSPQGCGCKSNIASQLADEGVKIMLAGSMGDGAYNKLKQSGIEVLRGLSGNVEMAAISYLAGLVSDNNETCHHECHS